MTEILLWNCRSLSDFKLTALASYLRSLARNRKPAAILLTETKLPVDKPLGALQGYQVYCRNYAARECGVAIYLRPDRSPFLALAC